MRRKRRKRSVPFLHWCLTLVAAAAFSTAAIAQANNRSEKDKKITDNEITRAIEGQMLIDPAVFSHLIDTTTTQGIVTLDGSVENLLAKQRAKHIAESIKGVRSVVNRIKVKPDQEISNAALSENVRDALLADPAADSYEIKTSATDGRITLSGQVDSYQERQLAEDVAAGVDGVTEVQNNIVVRYKTNRSDAEIKQDVLGRLEQSVWVDDALIDVKVKDGKVMLSGTVGSAAERSRAIGDAWVAGTKNVDGEALKIEWWARDEMRRKNRYQNPSDDKIKQAVKDAFLYDPRVYSFNPTVTVTNGVVTLTGNVGDLKAKHAAEQDAMNTIGVWRVKNYLKVRPESERNDAAILKDIRNALKRNPYVNREDFTVSVANGHARIYGETDTYFAREQAIDALRGVKGVVHVSNHISVDTEWTLKSDWAIRADIRDELWWSPFVDSDEVTVSVDNGVATLTGTVDTWSERASAEENAREGGAKAVINKLAVNYGPTDYQP